jgi:hypothetical protein
MPGNSNHRQQDARMQEKYKNEGAKMRSGFMMGTKD